jgi:hypothetical protein
MRKSVANLVVKLIEDMNLHVNESLGMEKAGTEADRVPSWLRNS